MVLIDNGSIFKTSNKRRVRCQLIQRNTYNNRTIKNKMSSPSSTSTIADFDDLRDFLVPWSMATVTGGITCSPVRQNTLICMDVMCPRHAISGKGLGKEHGYVWKANTVEWIVVQSFEGLTPNSALSRGGMFNDWTMTEMEKALYGTDTMFTTFTIFFQHEVTGPKMKTYVATFEVDDIILNKEALENK